MTNLWIKRAALAILLAAPAVDAAAQEVAAKIGATDVTLDQARAMIETLAEREKTVIKTDPALIAQALRLMLVNQLVLKEAEAKKWESDPSVKSQIDRARDAIVTESYLQSVSSAPATFPSDADIQAFYAQNAQRLFVPRQFQLAQIFIAQPKAADQSAKDAAAKKLADVQAKLKPATADFSAVAKASSDDQVSGERGGEVGWAAENTIRPELLDKISVLAKGAVSEPILLDDGWHVMKLLDTKAAGPVPLEAVRPQIAAQLREQRGAQLRRAYVTQLTEKNPLSVNELALAKLVTAPATTLGAAPKAAETAPAPIPPSTADRDEKPKRKKN